MEAIDLSRIMNFKEIPDHLVKYIVCKLCKNISINPRIERSCDNIFCKACLKDFFRKQGKKSCPFNCESLIKTKLSKIEKANLANITLSCKNIGIGCNFNYPFTETGQLLIHEKECCFNQLVCPICRKSIIYKNYTKHEQNCEREYYIKCDNYLKKEDCLLIDIKNENKELNKTIISFDKTILNLKNENETLKNEIKNIHNIFNNKTDQLEKQLERCLKIINVLQTSNEETKLIVNEVKEENSSIQRSIQKLDSNLDLGKKLMIFNYLWEKWGKAYTHVINKCLFSVRTQKYLPTFFRANIRVKPTGSLGWFVVGITRLNFSVDEKQFMWHNKEIKDCYVFSSNGHISDCYGPSRYGEEYSFNDIITVKYDKCKNISFEKNGKNLGVAFENVDGPFYLAASLYFTGDSVELMEVIEL